MPETVPFPPPSEHNEPRGGLLSLGSAIHYRRGLSILLISLDCSAFTGFYQSLEARYLPITSTTKRSNLFLCATCLSFFFPLPFFSVSLWDGIFATWISEIFHERVCCSSSPGGVFSAPFVLKAVVPPKVIFFLYPAQPGRRIFFPPLIVLTIFG